MIRWLKNLTHKERLKVTFAKKIIAFAKPREGNIQGGFNHSH